MPKTTRNKNDALAYNHTLINVLNFSYMANENSLKCLKVSNYLMFDTVCVVSAA